MYGHVTEGKKDRPQFSKNRNAIRLYNPFIYLLFLSVFLILTSCNDSDNSSSTEQKSMEILLSVEDAISKEMVGGLVVTPHFVMEGQAENLEVSLYDSEDHLLARYAGAESFSAGDIRVPGPGMLPLTLVIEGLNPLSGNAAEPKLNLVISGDDYFSDVASFDMLSSSGLIQKRLTLVPRSTDTDFPATFAEGNVAMDENRVTGAINLSTPVKSTDSPGGDTLDGAGVRLDISSGTEFFDESGQPFEPEGDTTAKIVFLSGDPKGLSTTLNSPLFAFPGGLEISGISGNTPDDLTNTSEFSFISAGFVAVEITDDAGNRVSGFRNGAVSLTFEVPKSTINPDTSLPLNFSDGGIPFWSYNEKSAKWSYEGNALIVAENTSTFTLTAQITHLTYFNLDWYQSNRCKWDVTVVDSNGQPNNQRLRLSFVRKSGGWAYKPYGWGGELDKLNIQRIPAFEGTFDILSADGSSLLESITVDGVETSAPDDGAGVELSDFCFGLGTDSVKTFTAKLNAENPPRIDLSLQLNLVCPTDNSSSITDASGNYYLYEGWSYIESGTVSSGQIDLQNLVEDGSYRFYYYNSPARANFEFTASTDLTELNIDTISACPTISQDLKIRLVCLDNDQSILRQKPAASARYWIYNRDYSQYISGTTNSDGEDTLTETVDGIEYLPYAYIRNNRRYLWSNPVAFTATEDQQIVIDINLPEDDSFCGDELPIDYTQTTLSASDLSAPADGTTKIQITVQEKDEFGNNRNSNTGTLTLTSTPSNSIIIDNIQSMGDGTYTADIYTSTPADVIVTGAIDGTALSDSVSVSFTDIPASATQSTFIASETSTETDTSITLNIVLKSEDGSDYGQSGGTLNVSSTPPGATFDSVTDNGDGTYSATVTSATAADYSLTATVGSVTLTTTPSVSFTDPLPSASQSSFTVSSATAQVGSNVTVNITLNKADGSSYGQSGGALSLSATPASATFSSVTDNGDGTYSAIVTSTTEASYALTATVGSVTLTTTPTVAFSYPPPSASQSSFTVSSATADTNSNVTINITLNNSDGSNYGRSGGNLALSSAPAGATFGSVTNNGDGTYSATVTSATATSYSLTATMGGVTLTTTPSVTFSDPLPSASQSTFTVGSTSASVGTDIPINITLNRADGSGYGQSGGVLTLISTPVGATFGSVTDNSDGTYTATVGSAGSASYTLTADIGGVTLTTTPSVSFTQVDPGNTTLSPTTLVVSVAGGPEITTLTLRQADNSLVGHGGHLVTVASTFIDTLGIIPSPIITDNSDGTYTISASCTIAIGSADTVTVSVDSVAVGTFSLDCDP